MLFGEKIFKLRKNKKLSQEEFAELFGVSRQAVQKWESGNSVPELAKIIEISKYFAVSLDELILDRDKRNLEAAGYNIKAKPLYEDIPDWEFYSADILDEYRQCVDEGLDIEEYKDIFDAVAKLPKSEIKKDFGDIIYKIVSAAKPKESFKYIEPSALDAIKSLRKGESISAAPDKKFLEDKIHGGWLGRICGCMLGKTVEGIRTNEFTPFLKETGNYPMHRYIYRSDLNDEICKKYNFAFASRAFADEIDGMPIDDDTNYIALAQVLVKDYGRDFTPADVAHIWVNYQSKNQYCTAERVAFCNFVAGFTPPASAFYKNPYREWIGAQIRGDYFGYINPGDPEAAADMAWRDASISHVKNGIYGEMFASAMIATAAVCSDTEKIIMSGLAQVPHTSRLYAEVMDIVDGFKSGRPQKDAFRIVHERYDEYTQYGWTHTIPNAMIVAAALLYGGGDYGKSICMAVETGFDTDCNGATVGSILGVMLGADAIPEYWKKPINDTLHTSIFGVGTVKIADRVKLTMEHLPK